ncbi:sensor histidine kinase [Brachybacterium sacelli]|uniref:Signal transduction histidine kinase n=1 Tax=Brachybacterium sacelli TaxID=173364 RepID=A0ABS4WX96_9MICO|nr:hypothetical protein [Brachybacterium sacelli]MBP2380835.1 signal transduction histidine kinase [Brachybacterium sacelli]
MTGIERAIWWRRARIAALVATVNVVGFAAVVAEQAVEWSSSWTAASLIWWVGGTTLVIGLVLVAVVTALGAVIRIWWVRVGLAVVLTAVQALVRTSLLLPATEAGSASPRVAVIWGTGMIGYTVALGAGYLVVALLAREDRERARREAEQGKARQAISDLEGEELRVRRLVADKLHGAVQHRLVVIASGLDRAAAELDGPTATRWAPTLRDWAQDLDELREEDVRVLSHSLFPSGADLGAYEAIRALLDRLPASVAASVVLGPRMQELVHAHHAPLTLVDRLVVVYTVEEAVTNAIKHGGAETVTVQVEVEQHTEAPWVLDVVIDDDGHGPQTAEPALSGLARHRARAEARGGSLELGHAPDGGGRLHLVLPFTPVVGA